MSLPSSGPIRWYENDNASFTTHEFGPGTLHAAIEPADIDQDGDLDLVSLASLEDGIYVHYNICGSYCGVDDLVVIEEHLVVVHEAAFLAQHRLAVDQVAGAQQQFGAPRAEPVAALVDEEPVIGADKQVSGGIERAGAD